MGEEEGEAANSRPTGEEANSISFDNISFTLNASLFVLVPLPPASEELVPLPTVEPCRGHPLSFKKESKGVNGYLGLGFICRYILFPSLFLSS
nr:hypothetical protein Q903MT_gene5112 [Picea sitchensis]